MRGLASFVTGRRTKWIVPVLWLLLVFGLAPLGAKLKDTVDDRFESFLPKKAESTTVAKLQRERFRSGQTAGGIVVYRRAGGLTAADRARIASDARRAASQLKLKGPPIVPFQRGSPKQLVSADHELAYSLLSFENNFKTLGKEGKKLRGIVGHGGGGLEVYVTGRVGFSADFEEIFGSVDTKLLFATVLLVLVLLGAIYRAPLIAIAPLLVVGFAYTVAQGLIYLYVKSGATVNSNGTQILVVLMFGVGTDYCLLLVSRYREELRSTEDKHEAMANALTRTGPAILASGLTVALTMLTLLVAHTGSVHSLGPVAAIGVTSVLLAAVTLLPALLTIFGRTGFWPRRRIVAFDPDHAIVERAGLWRRFGDRILKRPGLALGATAAIFAVGSLGILVYKKDYSTQNAFKKKTESVDGFNVLKREIPAGVSDPTIVLVERSNGPVRPQDLSALAARVGADRAVAAATPLPERSIDGRIGQVGVVFKHDPYTPAAFAAVPRIRDKLKDPGPGLQALVGSGSAVQYDFDASTSRDLKWIIPIGLLVIGVILGILLQAVAAPLVLIATVVASFFGTLGISLFFFLKVVGDPGVDASLPIFAFIFLVGLGVDYTIFLMSRVREEARLHGTREGTLRALAATGPVITSAGLILAGTFSVLMTLPVTFAFNIGFMVAVGILLDTFVVRTVMVPAAVELLGDRVWWPSDPSGGRRALTEDAPTPSASPKASPAS
ncbi:MAG: putative drug exporter of the superfamily [Thermoleophilaceae bacterium]|jgi:RND superfamily putative drug exporter|nr:putative drug exporter of the superfamily [Thermoleophilaceae bacterium]